MLSSAQGKENKEKATLLLNTKCIDSGDKPFPKCLEYIEQDE